jgi:lipopolysaccharide/colanic/teichoic acid biosynthesis glycosyltransferase
LRMVEISEVVGVSATLHVPVGTRRRVDQALKRLMDIVVALFLLVLVLPVFLFCVVSIAIESRGPVFYRCRRVGLRGADLWVLKFRKMKHGEGGAALTAPADERFTRLGPLLAKTKLDELPQLWSVLKGDMSLVGPRPEDDGFVRLRAEDYAEILTVRPGITGLSQLAFAAESEILDPHDRIGHYVNEILPQKTALDRIYVSERTLGMDIKIIVWTFLPVLLRKDVAVNRASGALTVRNRPAVTQA